MEYLQIHFTPITEVQSEIFIAQLNEIGFDGFEEEDNSLKAFVSIDKFHENLFNNIIEINKINYSKSIIKEQNWNEKWEADFEPVLVNHPTTSKPFVYIRANFHEPNILFEYNIEVTPKMSFGTGHHATTFLMVQQMSQINFAGKSVIDFGTGTGVLAILAEKMGAKAILAIDCDDWSINNAKENIEVNGCTNINLLKAETITAGNTADIVLANINLNIISANIDAIKQAAKTGAPILFSGIMLHDEKEISQVISNASFQIKHIFKKDNWLAILCVNG